MATKTATIDAGEWIYVDSTGIQHTVTTAETFTFTLTDGGATAVTYNPIVGQSVATDDGYVLTFKPMVNGSNTALTTSAMADTSDAVNQHNPGGEWPIECSVNGVVQNWKIAELTVDNVDAPTAITRLVLQDQFGNEMVLPSTGSGITVA